MPYEQVADRVELLMWVALLFCAVAIVHGILHWQSGGQDGVSSGLFASFGPVVFLLRHVTWHPLWLLLLAAAYLPIVVWRMRLRRARSRQIEVSRGLAPHDRSPQTRLVFILTVCDVLVALVAIWYIGNPVVVIATILLVNILGLVGARTMSPKAG